MDTNWFKGKRVTVFGIGLLGGGVGTIRFLVEHGARVIATDIKSREKLALSLEQLKDFKNVEYVLGQHRQEDFTKVDMVIKTPQAPWTNKHIKLALKNNIPVEVDSSLFFLLCKNPIIGITGTKGKTTTSHLIYHILKKSGKNPIKIGIGQTPVLDRLKLLKKNSVVVFELSSWRLSALAQEKMSPHIGVFTNFFPDHMNYYRSMDAYLKDKKNIFIHQKPKDWFICNKNDETVAKLCDEAKGNVLCVAREHVSDGRSVFMENGEIFINDGIDITAVMKVNESPLRGAHNINNIMCAIGATFAYGVPTKSIISAVKSFNGVAHRLEFVTEKKGVRYYNDTAATNPDSACVALDSFESPIVLIAGGVDKNLAYEEFAKKIIKKVKGVVFLKGTATEKIVSLIRKELGGDMKKISFEVVDAMDKAVEIATLGAEEGDVVLLSPGAASFGIFSNEFDRGNQFKKEVLSL
ncbi:MAG: UDP-N-acetylmuramoyl-L-alanine--D-glutamate ligase [Candidatus Moraniibacteriota bacterium]|nr:MAG: UDP-N-acetylmuramoyl-L-alanine--D-glutamate ligase [Candidatus Moranbacteria bacterium]